MNYFEYVHYFQFQERSTLELCIVHANNVESGVMCPQIKVTCHQQRIGIRKRS